MKQTKFKETEVGRIPDDWRAFKLGHLCNIKYGKGLPERNRKPGNYPIYGSNGVVYWHERPFVPGPGIIIGRKGSIGTIVYSAKDYWPIDTAFYIEPPTTGAIDLKFLYYQLKTFNLKERGTDSAVPGLNRDVLADIDLNVPDIDEQKKIAEILGALDEKVELNRKMNRTLESLAQNIFKKWFIFSEEKKMPKSYTSSSLDKIADFLNGIALQKFPAQNESDSLPVIKIKELKTESTANSDNASSNIDSKYIVQNGDILFSWSGSLDIVIWCGGDGALNQHLFKVTSKEHPKWFYYYWIKYYLEYFQMIAASKATTMGHIQRHHLTNAIATIPDKKTMGNIDSVMSPIVDSIINNKIEITTISKIRDSLLPRLMSGKLRVR